MLVVWVFSPGSPGVKPLVGSSGVGNEIRGEPSLAFTYKLNMPYEYTKTCHKPVRQTCCTSIQYSTDGVLISLVQAHLRTIKINSLTLHNMCKQHFNNHV